MSTKSVRSPTGWRKRLWLYGGLLLMGFLLLPWWAHRNTYPIPDPGPAHPPPEPIREVFLDTAETQAWPAYFLPCALEKAPLVIFFHGNGQDLDNLVDSGFMGRFPALGAHLLAVEYPGYGHCLGRPSEASLMEIADAAMDWCFANYPDAPKLIMGWSLGAAVAVQTAQRFQGQCDGLILLSAWTSLTDVAAHHYPRWLVRLALREPYDSLAAASGQHLPTLVIHGALDSIVPIAQGKTLAKVLGLNGPCEFIAIKDRGHNDLLDASLTWLHLHHFLQNFAQASS